jgi:hypothetical protein
MGASGARTERLVRRPKRASATGAATRKCLCTVLKPGSRATRARPGGSGASMVADSAPSRLLPIGRGPGTDCFGPYLIHSPGKCAHIGATSRSRPAARIYRTPGRPWRVAATDAQQTTLDCRGLGMRSCAECLYSSVHRWPRWRYGSARACRRPPCRGSPALRRRRVVACSLRFGARWRGWT